MVLSTNPRNNARLPLEEIPTTVGKSDKETRLSDIRKAIVRCKGIIPSESARAGRGELERMSERKLVSLLLALVPKAYAAHLSLRTEIKDLKLEIENLREHG